MTKPIDPPHPLVARNPDRVPMQPEQAFRVLAQVHEAFAAFVKCVQHGRPTLRSLASLDLMRYWLEDISSLLSTQLHWAVRFDDISQQRRSAEFEGEFRANLQAWIIALDEHIDRRCAPAQLRSDNPDRATRWLSWFREATAALDNHWHEANVSQPDPAVVERWVHTLASLSHEPAASFDASHQSEAAESSSSGDRDDVDDDGEGDAQA